jgi:uncharacterized protein YvpB/LysM repeat protein
MTYKAFILTSLALLITATAGHAQAQSIPDQAYISGVVGHPQQYTLSCESRSAADWAGYWGVSIDETEFLNRLPFSDNPNEGFVGYYNDPWGYIPPASYGVHAEPIAETLRSYGLDAHAGIGISWDEVRTEVAANRPVIVWVIGQIWAGAPSEYETDGGEIVTVANNEHTMIVIGYDENRVHLVDALTGYTVTHSLENFLSSWNVLGNMAVIGEGSGQLQNDNQPIPSEGDYLVQRGDTLNKIAARIGVFWPDLAAWNNISFPYVIYPGQMLITSPNGSIENDEIPEPDEENVYTVQNGDLLIDIAKELDVDWLQFAQFNSITPPYLLQPGTVLEIPPDDSEIEIQIPEIFTASRTESLASVALFYGLDWIELAAANHIGYPYLLVPGQSIQLQ